MILHARLLELIRYEPLTGWFYYANSRGKYKTGDVAGWWDGSSYKLRIGGVQYLAHRLAWFYITGEWPAEEIDHKDGDRSNNIFSNLRLASSSQNKCNKLNYTVSESGSRGVYPNRKGGPPWRSTIQVGGRQIHLGLFYTIPEASAAYLEAAELYHGEFALHNRPNPEPQPFIRRI